MSSFGLVIRGVMLSTTVMVVAACGSGSSSGSSSDPANDPPTAVSAPELANLSPASLSLSAQSGQSTSAVLSFSNAGDAALTYTLSSSDSWVTLPSNASGSVAENGIVRLSVQVACADADLNGTLNLSTNDSDEQQNAVPIAVTCTASPTDLAIQKVTFNQAARAFDSSLSVSPQIDVLAGREMLVRAFVTGAGQAPEARVVVSRPGMSDAVFNMSVPPSIGAVPADESLLSASHYVVVPGTAITADAELKVELAPFTTPVSYPDSGSGMALNAIDAGAFEVTFVPVTFAGQTPSLDGATYIRQALEVLPIGELDIEIRTPYTFSGDFDLEDLLMELSDLRNLDGSDRLYHGVIIPPSGGTSTTAGVGFVGYPVSVSVDLGGAAFVIAHEMGHNLNLGHAPGCDSPEPDSAYPYTAGAVTGWGYNITNNSLVAPTATKRDFMSYCNDLWVSDYHFDKAMDFLDQSPVSSASPAGLGLSISGRIKQGRLLDLGFMPTPRVIASRKRAQESQLFEFVAWDQSGQEILRKSFAVHAMVDAGSGDAFIVNVPMPTVAIDHYQISRQNQVMLQARMPSQIRSVNTVDLQWRNDGVTVNWQPLDGQMLVVRDQAGTVLNINRSGSLQLTTTQELSFQLISQRHIGQASVVPAGHNQRLELTL